MALSSAIEWDVRDTGADTNGGGFKLGATGVDYSQQAAAQYAASGMTSSGAGAIILYGAAATDMVGNIINITGGTNFTTGWYEITAASAGVSITVDRNATTGVGASGTGNIGGALLSLAKLETLNVAGNTGWIKASLTTTLTVKATLSVAGTTAAGSVVWQGYETTHGDNTGTRPIITSATSTVNLFEMGAGIRVFSNLKFTHSGATRGYAFDNQASGTTNGILIVNCIFDGVLGSTKFDNLGAQFGGTANMHNCDVINCTGVGIRVTGAILTRCRINNNTGGGILIGDGSAQNSHIVGCLITSNGADGITSSGSNPQYANVIRNTIASNTGDGIDFSSTHYQGTIDSNIIYNNGAFGVKLASQSKKSVILNNNAFGANTSGDLSNATAGTGDVALTGDPFTNKASGDYSLNNTAGAGAVARAAAAPGLFKGGLTTGYLDIGAIQHQDSGGAATPQRSYVG